MLHDAGTVEAIDIRERDRLRALLDAEMNEADVVVGAAAQDGEVGVRDDVLEAGGVGVPALLVKGVVLDQVRGHVGQEGGRGRARGVEEGDEGGEDGALLGRGGGAWGAVGCGGWAGGGPGAAGAGGGGGGAR